MGVKGALHQRKEFHDLVAEDLGKQWRAEPAVAMLAAGGATQPDHRVGDVGEQRGDAGLPTLLGDVGQQVAVQMAIARMTEEHHLQLMILRRLPHRAHVLAQFRHRHATVFDHLKRAARFG